MIGEGIHLMSCVDGMAQMTPDSVDIAISSPPYNVGIEYGTHNDNQAWEAYDQFMGQVLAGMYRVVRVGGRVCWNIPSFSSRQNLYERFLRLFRAAGFQQYAEIIWDKKQISSRTAWGSFKSASQPNLLPPHEYVLVFYKGQKNHGKGVSDITNEEFVEWSNAMWQIKPETKSEHPAPFPVELPLRCMKFLSHADAHVLDPFTGSGTTALAARMTGRRFTGFEIDPRFHAMALSRMGATPK